MVSALSVYLLQAPILITAATRSGPVDREAYLNAAWPVLLAIGMAAPLLYGVVLLFPESTILNILATLGAAYALPLLILTAFPRGRTTLAMVWAAVPTRVSTPLRRWAPGWLTAAAQ